MGTDSTDRQGWYGKGRGERVAGTIRTIKTIRYSGERDLAKARRDGGRAEADDRQPGGK
jgi:hypothetical protein